MDTMRNAGEAVLLAHEGQLQLAALLAAGMCRQGTKVLDWVARMLNHTGSGTSYTG